MFDKTIYERYTKEELLDQISFKGDLHFLSNMTPAPIVVRKSDPILAPFWDIFELEDGDEYPTSEHFYMSMKSSDPEWREYCKTTKKAVKVKRKSYEIQVREDWELMRLAAMSLALQLKFRQNPDLKAKLLDTEGLLEERNIWGDSFYGIYEGQGKNYLSRFLTSLRECMKAEEEAKKNAN